MTRASLRNTTHHGLRRMPVTGERSPGNTRDRPAGPRNGSKEASDRFDWMERGAIPVRKAVKCRTHNLKNTPPETLGPQQKPPENGNQKRFIRQVRT